MRPTDETSTRFERGSQVDLHAGNETLSSFEEGRARTDVYRAVGETAAKKSPEERERQQSVAYIGGAARTLDWVRDDYSERNWSKTV